MEINQYNEEKTFKEIYDQNWSRLFHFALNVIGDRAACEDIIQDVFISFWQKRNDLKVDNISAYLFQSVKFQIFKYLRNNKITKRHLNRISLLQNEYNIEGILEAKELALELKQIIKKLPERCQQIFMMSRFEHLTNQEIAVQLGLSVQTVKNQISKALSYLRKEMSSDMYFLLLFFLSYQFFLIII